jgi:hypothetical protein
MLEIDIAGNEPGQFDRLTVQGSAKIAGTLTIDEHSGSYTPPTEPGRVDRFDILTAQSITGQFDALSLVGQPLELGHQGDGLFRWIEYDDQSVSLIHYRAIDGDANGDGAFDSGDLVGVFQAGEYEDLADDNSNWVEGDWDGDLDFSSSDFILAFQSGRYEQSPLFGTATHAVPEPSTACLLMFGFSWYIAHRRRSHGRFPGGESGCSYARLFSNN